MVRTAGLERDFGPLGTAFAGEADAVVAALAEVLRAALAHGASRVTLIVEPDTEDAGWQHG